MLVTSAIGPVGPRPVVLRSTPSRAVVERLGRRARDSEGGLDLHIRNVVPQRGRYRARGTPGLRALQPRARGSWSLSRRKRNGRWHPGRHSMVNVAEIRFYAELNDFLAPDRRQRAVRYPFEVSPSVKDAIEALGVPHTEVSLILANGDPIDFAYRLADGDRISVFPAFETFDVSRTSLVRSEPLRRLRFVADTHLGKLARYLRLLGFDTRFDTDWNDDALARTSSTEGRVLLTRDRGLLKRRVVAHGLFIRASKPRDQLFDVVRRLHLVAHLQPFTRCMACNGELETVDKAGIIERLEPATRSHFEAFHRCRELRAHLLGRLTPPPPSRARPERARPGRRSARRGRRRRRALNMRAGRTRATQDLRPIEERSIDPVEERSPGRCSGWPVEREREPKG